MIGESMEKKSYMDGGEPEVGEIIVITDYISAGEMVRSSSSKRNSSCTCESAVQVLIFPHNADVLLFKLDFVIRLEPNSKSVTTKLLMYYNLPRGIPSPV